MSSTNYNLETQLAVCRQAIAEAEQHRIDYNARYDYLNTQIDARRAEKNDMTIKGYYVNDSKRARFTGCTDGGIGGRNGGCLTGQEHNGGNVFNDGGYYARNRKEYIVACGGLGNAYETTCQSGVFDGICHDAVLNGCLNSLHQDKNWTYLSKNDVTYYSQPFRDVGCHSGTVWKPTASIHTPWCKKTDSRMTFEKSQLDTKQAEIDSLVNQINGLKPPTVEFNCQICSNQNTINCGVGATCSGIDQANSCVQSVQNAYMDCKSKNGVYDETTKTCKLPLDCQVSEWSEWTPCSSRCGSGSQTRSRQILQAPENNGQACPFNLSETRPCEDKSECPVDCQVSWEPSGTCSTTCGVGNQKLVGTVLIQSKFGGKACPTVLVKNESCQDYTNCNNNPPSISNTNNQTVDNTNNNSLIYVIIGVVAILLLIILML